MYSQKRPRKGGNVASIFVHAGAGYHSEQNEANHLAACRDAAAAGMEHLRIGGIATDAVEIAIRVLEDREITNAGFGSNLALDGVVECDAVLVDHLGRSGACGAVAQVRNPISLARTILDRSTKTLSLRRVPPNLLVGQGATNFAGKSNMEVSTHDALISDIARDRWVRWKLELMNTRKDATDGGQSLPFTLDFQPFVDEDSRRKHTRMMEEKVLDMLRPTPPPDDVAASTAPSSKPVSVFSQKTVSTCPSSYDHSHIRPGPMARLGNDFYGAMIARIIELPDPLQTLTAGARNDDLNAVTAPHVDVEMSDIDEEDEPLEATRDGNNEFPQSITSTPTSKSLSLPSITPSPEPCSPTDKRNVDGSAGETAAEKVSNVEDTKDKDDDHITDTVGAIAIDMYGNIACGASSGGIGMKHRGRLGPAALVGVGAAVVPTDADDSSNTCVAVVTSGTGEHMATTMAATMFSERLYSGCKKVRGGILVPCEDDDEIIKNVIEKEFMGHPSVRNSSSNGAIGVLCVKSTKDGINLHFAHNTDSFAMASQFADEAQPSCTMSRNKSSGAVALGGRAHRC